MRGGRLATAVSCVDRQWTGLLVAGLAVCNHVSRLPDATNFVRPAANVGLLYNGLYGLENSRLRQGGELHFEIVDARQVGAPEHQAQARGSFHFSVWRCFAAAGHATRQLQALASRLTNSRRWRWWRVSAISRRRWCQLQVGGLVDIGSPRPWVECWDKGRKLPLDNMLLVPDFFAAGA